MENLGHSDPPDTNHESPNPDDIASAVLQRFAKLPANCKPRIASENGQKEWVPLAGIVAHDTTVPPPNLYCISLATGMKCSPSAHLLSSAGTVLHDSHAEVLAIRAFNRHLLTQCLSLLTSQPLTSPVLIERSPRSSPDSPPFHIRPSINFYMYTSTCPCGDASMDLLISRTPDSTPWSNPPSSSSTTTPSSPISSETAATTLLGRGHFSLLGLVRRKPSRPDAPPTLSKSCSDKLALKQCLSLLSSLTALLVDPGNVYLHALIMPHSEIHAAGVERAWGGAGRMKPLMGWKDGEYEFRPFEIWASGVEFEFVREEGAKASEKACVVYGEEREVVINGVLQGRKRTDPRGASGVSRRRMWALARELAVQLGDEGIFTALEGGNYGRVKDVDLLASRAAAKRHVTQHGLPGWAPNSVDRDWSL
ncbi:hypothetical protein K461DRAFT_294972 [Myriangium duriaei CBS 260.36]|uniref:A to I editase domain-containing protein n=1 Tax=Myriangium duriaei CBS 260.36 TaxID=1168546 RepID=A0A9P4J496_9PEZI|nr:hypothetical protein K461DRAFT_294972 [Myriangium duriaei CBS 260.36]